MCSVCARARRACVCVCLFNVMFADLRKNRCLPLPLVFPHFICFRPLVSSRPPSRTGTQGAEEAEGGSQAKARCRCDLGLLAGTPGTPQPPPPRHSRHESATYRSRPPRPPHLSVCLSLSTLLPAHCCNHTSVYDGMVFKPLTGFHPRG